MVVVGAIFGSFLCCQAHRLRRHEKGMKPLGSRSVCLHCKHQLRWYENLPLISWPIQSGKCRHCDQKIGAAEIISELLTACAFLLIAVTLIIFATHPAAPSDVFGVFTPFGVIETTSIQTLSPSNWVIFFAVIALVCLLIFLAIYDGLYGELPTLFLTFSVICAIIIVILRIWSFFSSSIYLQISEGVPIGQMLSTLEFTLNPLNGVILAPIISAAIFGGLYLFLYLVSKGRWVGDGDWILCVAIGLALGRPLLALVALFVANLSACLVMAPLVKKRKSHQIYFGPFLVVGFIITVFVASML